jgi:hypothetical protein
MQAVEGIIEATSIAAFFVMMSIWAGVGTNWPLV